MNTDTPECSVIIPVFNKWHLTRDCLVSLYKHSEGHDIEVLVVDNGSGDATASDLAPLGRSLFGSRFSSLVFPENRNFGPACNAGARLASAPFLFFLNNDTILSSNWAGPLLEILRTPDAPGAVCPLLLYEEGTVQHLGVALGAEGVLHLYQGFPPDHPVVFRKRPLQFISGAAFMMPRELFWDCGGFHEGYKNGFEDLELCVRIREKGKQLRCIPESRIYHLESQTQGRKDDDAHNGILLAERCGKDMFIDLHHHAIRDGFQVTVNDFLALSPGLSEKDEAALPSAASRQPADEWLRMTAQNPFWIHGREILAQSLEKAGKPEDAVMFRISLAEIEPTEARYKDLMRLAPYAADACWPVDAARSLEKIIRCKTDVTYAKARVREIRKRFQAGGDSFLEEAYHQKLSCLFKENDEE